MTSRQAAIYCRISQDRTGAGLGVARQREDCEALATRLGWKVVTVLEDNDLSAYSGKPRPGYLALLEAIRRGEVTAVLAWHEDRLHRSPRELEDYIDTCEPRKVPTHFAQAGELDLVTASGRMTARIRGAVTRAESEHKSERTRRAQLQAAQAGKWLGGAQPFGWIVAKDGGAVLDRGPAREVREATTAILGGASLGSVVADLNRRGVTTSTGRAWNYTSLRQVLLRPRNAGLSVLNDEVVGTSVWPPILTEQQWRSVVAVLEDPTRRQSKSNVARWLLAGIAVCGTCGGPLRSATVAKNRARGTNRTVYRCRVGGGGHVARAAQDVDDLVTAVIIERMRRDDWRDVLLRPGQGGTPDGDALRVDAVALRGRLVEAADEYADGNITAGQLAQITAKVRDRLDDVEAAMGRTVRGSTMAPFVSGRDPQTVWSGLTVDRRRAVLEELMTVTVLAAQKRGNVFDPESVRIEWRQL